MTDAIISAAPGFFMVIYDKEDAAPGDYVPTSRQPVIAWAIDPAGGPFSARPITVHGSPAGHIYWGVLYVDAQGEHVFYSVTEPKEQP
jgi:hypothetical protein